METVTHDVASFAFPFTTLITIAIVVMTVLFSIRVGKMHGKHNIKVPTMFGHPEFDRAHRVHMNTVEQLVLFLPMVWIFAALVSDLYAGIAGIVWIIGRLLFSIGYMQEAGKRGKGFGITFLALAVTTIWVLVATIMQLV